MAAIDLSMNRKAFEDLINSADVQTILTEIENIAQSTDEKVEGNCMTEHLNVHNRLACLKEKQLNLFTLGKFSISWQEKGCPLSG